MRKPKTPKFRETPYLGQEFSPRDEGDLTRIEYERYRATQQLPGAYPFWSRNCAQQGMTYIDYDTTIAGSRNSVLIEEAQLTVGGNRTTPMIIAWMREANDDLTYSDSTPIYKFPCTLFNSSGVVTEAFSQGFNYEASNKLLFARHGVTAYGTAGTKRMYIKYFVLLDDTQYNVKTDTTANTAFS